MIGIRKVNQAGIDDAQPTHQHMVELDEWENQPPLLRPRAHPALTRRTVRVGTSRKRDLGGSVGLGLAGMGLLVRILRRYAGWLADM